MGKRGKRAWTLCMAVLLIVTLGGVAIQPKGAVPKWAIGNEPSVASDRDNALRVAKTAFARYRLFQNLLVVSFKVEEAGKWDERASSGCNDKWVVSARTLFGLELGRAAYLCGGIDSYWI